MKRVVLKRAPEMGWVGELGHPPDEAIAEVWNLSSRRQKEVKVKLFNFGDKVRINHDAPGGVGGRFGVVMRSGTEGAWVVFFDQSEAHVLYEHLRGPSDAEWWGFMRRMT